MAGEDSSTIKDIDLKFRHSPARVVMLTDCTEIDLLGIKVGPFNKDEEITVDYWIANESVKYGLARFHDDSELNMIVLNKIHWREMIQPGKKFSTLPENFYPSLRRCLSNLNSRALKDPSSVEEKSKALRIAQDIVNCRLNKVVRLALAPEQTGEILQMLSPEEKMLYDRLRAIILDWKLHILNLEVDK